MAYFYLKAKIGGRGLTLRSQHTARDAIDRATDLKRMGAEDIVIINCDTGQELSLEQLMKEDPHA